MKKIITSILLINFLFTTNVYALTSNSTFEDIVKHKYEIPKNILIKKKNKKYGVIDKNTKEVLIPYKYNSIKRLGIDTVLLCKDFDDDYTMYGPFCLISTNNDIHLTNDISLRDTTIKKIFKTIFIDKNKTKDIENTIFWIDSKILIYPKYNSKNFFKDIIESNNKISRLKFEDYPYYDKDAFLFLNRANNNKYGYYIRPYNYGLEISKYAYSNRNKNSSIIAQVLGINYFLEDRYETFNEEIVIKDDYAIIRYKKVLWNKKERPYNVIYDNNKIRIEDKNDNIIVPLIPYLVEDNILQKDIEKIMKDDSIDIFKDKNKKTFNTEVLYVIGTIPFMIAGISLAIPLGIPLFILIKLFYEKNIEPVLDATIK